MAGIIVVDNGLVCLIRPNWATTTCQQTNKIPRTGALFRPDRLSFCPALRKTPLIIRRRGTAAGGVHWLLTAHGPLPARIRPLPMLAAAADVGAMSAHRRIASARSPTTTASMEHLYGNALLLSARGLPQPGLRDAMGPHVTTLRYRLARIQELFGVNLDTPERRLPLSCHRARGHRRRGSEKKHQSSSAERPFSLEHDPAGRIAPWPFARKHSSAAACSPNRRKNSPASGLTFRAIREVQADADDVPTIDLIALRRAGTFVTGAPVIPPRQRYLTLQRHAANSFTSVSLDPPLLLVCVGKARRAMRRYRLFCRTPLHEGQTDVSAVSPPRLTTSSRPSAMTGPHRRSPRVPDLVDCTVHNRVDAGDHIVLIGAWFGTSPRRSASAGAATLPS